MLLKLYLQICDVYLRSSRVQFQEDEHKIMPYLHLYDQWIGFEDELTIFLKTEYAINQQLGGIFLWTLDLDDFQNSCGWGHFPLLNAASQAVYKNHTFSYQWSYFWHCVASHHMHHIIINYNLPQIIFATVSHQTFITWKKAKKIILQIF